MSIEVRSGTEFDDVCTVVGPKRPDANVCWGRSYRLSSKENRARPSGIHVAGGRRVDRLGRVGWSLLPAASLAMVTWAAAYVLVGESKSVIWLLPAVVLMATLAAFVRVTAGRPVLHLAD